MLMKLLKYDFRANLKIYFFAWPAIVVLCLIQRLILLIDSEEALFYIVIAMGIGMLMLSLLAINAFAFILPIIRFHSGLLGREGYLMFTLPVKPWQLIISKFITAIAMILITGVLSIAGACFVLDGFDGFMDTLQYIWESTDSYSRNTLIIAAVASFISTCVTLMQIYMCDSLGQLFRKYRILWSVLIYFGINFAMQMISIVFSLVLIAVAANVDPATVTEINVDSTFANIISIIPTLITGVAFFFISEYVLRKRLNLE